MRTGKKVNLKEPLDIDKIPIRRDSFFPNAYVIELPLESQPDYIWRTLFEREWKSSLHLWDRKVVIVGDKLLLVTTPTDIQEKIDWLKGLMKSTNERLTRFNQAQQAKDQKEKTEALRKHENIIRDALRMILSIK